MKIIISIVLAFFLVACSEDKASSSSNQDIFKEVTSPVKPAVIVTEEVKEPALEVAPIAVEIVEESSRIVLEETTEVIEDTKGELTPIKSGVDLYKVCSSCHGVNGEKKALNKSQVIQGWSEVQTSTALNGYKEGSYGGAMKGLMKSQVTKLSDADISALSKYISEL